MNVHKSDKLGLVTIPAPDETDNWQWVRADLALQIQEQRDELLAACKAVVLTWERDFRCLDTGYEGTPLEQDYKQCKAAIAKAEGRAE